MPFSIFSTKPNYYKNGMNWWLKMINRAIGENNYEYLRLEKRILSATFYYKRQEMLYKTYVAFPEIAHTIGIYPKVDSSHGFPDSKVYECFRDFQENTINSDGWFAFFVVYVCVAYSMWTVYCYLLPYYWTNRYLKNEEDLRTRMKDYFANSVYEELWGNQWMEFSYTPHHFHSFRNDLYLGYNFPDDVRAVHFSSINRKHKFREHYIHDFGNASRMNALG